MAANFSVVHEQCNGVGKHLASSTVTWLRILGAHARQFTVTARRRSHGLIGTRRRIWRDCFPPSPSVGLGSRIFPFGNALQSWRSDPRRPTTTRRGIHVTPHRKPRSGASAEGMKAPNGLIAPDENQYGPLLDVPRDAVRESFERLLAQGELLDGAEFLARTGITRQALSKAIGAQRLFYVHVDGRHAYPRSTLTTHCSAGKSRRFRSSSAKSAGEASGCFSPMPRARWPALNPVRQGRLCKRSATETSSASSGRPRAIRSANLDETSCLATKR